MGMKTDEPIVVGRPARATTDLGSNLVELIAVSRFVAVTADLRTNLVKLIAAERPAVKIRMELGTARTLAAGPEGWAAV